MNELHKGLSRRRFLALGSAAALSPVFPNISSFFSAAETPPKIALQLYTVRNEMGKDIKGTFRRLASIGIENVETAFWPSQISLGEAAQHLRDAGLKVCSAHVEIPTGNSKEAMLRVAETFGCKKMIWHGWPEDKRYSSLEGTKELVGIYNEAGAFAQSNGLQFGLHNHWWEYRNHVGGRPVFEWLLELVSPEIFFEIDTYWVKVAGMDPAKVIERFGTRAQFLHMKDGPARWSDNLAKDNPDPMVALGQGVQDFPSIVRAAQGNVRWMVIEMDKVASDVFTAIDESYQYLLKNHFAVRGS